jgi:hypothetical protein
MIFSENRRPLFGIMLEPAHCAAVNETSTGAGLPSPMLRA